MGVAPTLPSKLCVPHPLKWEMFRKNVNMVLQLDLNGKNNGFIPTPLYKNPRENPDKWQNIPTYL